MFSNLTFQYPAWFFIFCLLLGLGYAALLYYGNNSFRERSPNLHKWLALLRGLAVTLISMLLLAPLLKNQITETKQPVVVIAQDASESIGSELSGDALTQYRANLDALRSRLSEKYDVRTLAFGDDVRDTLDFQFKDKVTNLSDAMSYIYDQYGTLNLGAVVVATDGIYNEGSNPLYTSAQNSTAPVYAIALGDTMPKRDLMIKRVLNNKIAYLGDKTIVQVDLSAYNLAGNQTVLSLSKVEGDQVSAAQQLPVTVSGNAFFTTKEFTIEANKPGILHYRLSASKLNGEVSGANNVRDLFIEVLDARQKVLLLANGPHPDITALKQTIEGNKNYVVTTHLMGMGNIDVTKFDFVVLHNLPGSGLDLSGIMSQLNANRIPRLFIAGAQTNMQALGAAQPLVSIQSDGRQTDDVNGKVAKSFAAFTLDPKLADELPKYAPLKSPFGTFTATPQAQVLLNKRIGKVDTEQPLLAFGETNGIKTGIFLGEGIWKWRLFNFLQDQNHLLFDELMSKTVQYLALKEDKRKFRVQVEKNIFDENEQVQFNAELYNDSYELINEPDASLVIKNKEGKEFSYTFNKQGSGYVLNAGIFPVGAYTYMASVQHNNQKHTAEGKFSVRAIEMELYETTANHGLLRAIAEKNGGKVVAPSELTSIADLITALPTIKPVIYETNTTDPLINLKWIFGLLAGLLCLEWFLRRYYGSY